MDIKLLPLATAVPCGPTGPPFFSPQTVRAFFWVTAVITVSNKSQMQLSIEVVDHILSFLQSDPVSLKACYNSHPLLSQLAERHQFAHVVLDDFNTRDTFGFESSEFTKIIHRRPHIAAYVRSIEMKVVEYSQELSSILSMMTLLRKVKLYGGGQWQSIPEHFRQAFLDCTHLRSMEDVTIGRLSDFPLFALYNIKRLTLCQWLDYEYPPNTTMDDSVAHKFQLDSLSLTDFERDSLRKVIAWLPSCTFRSLETSVDADYRLDDLPYQGLLDNCSNSLTDLQLSFGSRCMSCLSLSSTLYLNLSLVYSLSLFVGDQQSGESLAETVPFTLSTLPHLERITVRAKVNFSIFDAWDGRLRRRFSSPIPAIKHAMKTISSQRLKLLKLDFYFTIDGHHPLPPAEVIWSSLVQLVAESPFPCIKLHVKVAVDAWRRYRDIAPDIMLNSLAESAELMSYVNRGVLVLIPEHPN